MCTKAKRSAPSLPLAVIQARRDVCRECDQATRNPDPAFAAFNGLTKRSVCLRITAKHPKRSGNIARGTAMAIATCGKWDAAGIPRQPVTGAK